MFHVARLSRRLGGFRRVVLRAWLAGCCPQMRRRGLVPVQRAGQPLVAQDLLGEDGTRRGHGMRVPGVLDRDDCITLPLPSSSPPRTR